MNTAGRGTALITGASSGIGEAFARALAGRGVDLILVARREDRLQALAEELAGAYGVVAEPLAADLSSEPGLAAVECRVAALPDLALLVNNAGFGTPGGFTGTTPQKNTEMLWVHILASTRLARAALPAMLARKYGGIINVSSVAAFFALPGSGLYSATKAYLNVFSESLAGELRGTGVRVQALCPGFTTTGFHSTSAYQDKDVRGNIPGWMWMDSAEVAAASLRALERDQIYCIPGLKYKLLALVGRSGLVGPFVRAFGWRLGRMKSPA